MPWRILRWGYHSKLSKLVLNLTTRVLIWDAHRKEEAMWRQQQRSDWGSHKPQNADSHQKLEGARKDSPPRASWRAWLCWYLDFGLVPSRTVRNYFFPILSHRVFSNLLLQSQETDIDLDYLPLLLPLLHCAFPGPLPSNLILLVLSHCLDSPSAAMLPYLSWF